MPDDTLCLFPAALPALANPPLRSPLSLADVPLGVPGREPIAVRVGGTTFALRRFEAEQVLVALGTADTPSGVTR